MTFVQRKVLPAAREIVERTERLKLSERDTQRVLKLLEKPPEPTLRLLKAARAKLRAR